MTLWIILSCWGVLTILAATYYRHEVRTELKDYYRTLTGPFRNVGRKP